MWTVTLDNVLSLLGTLATIVAFIYGGGKFLGVIQVKLDMMAKNSENLEREFKDAFVAVQQELKKITEVLIVQGRHDERLTAMQLQMANQGRRLDDMTRRVNTYLDLKVTDQFEEDERGGH